MQLAHSLGLPDWEEWLGGKPKFRARQITSWLHQKDALSASEMSDLPQDLRDQLHSNFNWPQESMLENLCHSSTDKTAKLLFAFSENKKVETVWLPYENRQSICISVQAGCSLDCSFCATGKIKFGGNLSVGEILLQVYMARKVMQKKITNIVFMGMGEPFYNYENVVKAAHILHSQFGSGISTRRITISTSGVLPGIVRFTQEKQPFKLALSLHSAIPEKRARLMDIEKKYSITEILDFLHSNRNSFKANQLMIEYIMIRNFNMGDEDKKALIKAARKISAKINLIPLNTSFGGYKAPTEKEIDHFWRDIKSHNLVVINRRSPAKSIEGACGMLALQNG